MKFVLLSRNEMKLMIDRMVGQWRFTNDDMMRLTGFVPQDGLVTNIILEYCPLGVTQWPIEPVQLKSPGAMSSSRPNHSPI